MNEAVRFRFDFADLAPAPFELRVLEGGVEVPAAAERISGRPRPRWLGRLLPVFPEGHGLRLAVLAPAAPTLAGLLLDSLGGLLASAAAGSGVSVLGWDHHLLVGSHGLRRMPPEPHWYLVPADLLEASLAQAAQLLAILPRQRTLLVLNGRLPKLEHAIALPAGASLRRLPLVGATELWCQARGLPAALGSRRFGTACLALAQELCLSYRSSIA
ncbi:MAG: hypothetical protein E6I85_11150 [Chloroflexi bacterium]|nr:MAG: hypothetical protein E6I85_11150 [Chloroflexota bacterium]